MVSDLASKAAYHLIDLSESNVIKRSDLILRMK